VVSVKVYLVSIFSALILSVLLMVWMYKQWSLLAFINSASIIALIFLMVGGILFVVEGGFFSGIAYSFKRFYKKTTKTGKILDEIEKGEEDKYEPKTHSFSLTYPLILVGTVLFVVALALSYTI
jgi:hypothetical protein